MSTNRTEHYQLHAWEPGDTFLREEFNENFRLLDRGLGAKPELVTGVTTGDGTRDRFISLGFTPKAVLLFHKDGHTNSGYMSYGGLALPGFPVKFKAGDPLTIGEGGFYISVGESGSSRTYSNKLDTVCYYLAVR